MKIKFKKLHPKAVIPKTAKYGDAGADLIAISKTRVYDKNNKLAYVEYDTGIALEIPYGWEGECRPRSSISNTCMILCNAPGTIDAGYRGSIKARFKVLGEGNEYQVGDKIFQLLVKPVEIVEFVEVEELSQTERNDKGFGSSDV